MRAVLSDLTMPGKSGLEVRQLRPDVPVLLISGYSDEEVSGQLGGLRIDGVLHKPFGPGVILETLKAALGVGG